MGWKDFAPDVLTTSDVQDYLMNQSVMVFSYSSARSSALTSPSEGMVTYLQDTDELEIYNGSIWLRAVVTADDDSVSVASLSVGSNATVTGTVKASVFNAGANNVLGTVQVGDSAISGSDGNIVVGKNNAVGGNRHFKIGYDSGFNICIGDYGSGGSAGTWKAAIKMPYDTPDSTIVATSSGSVTTPKQPYLQARGAGAVWAVPYGGNLKNFSPASFQWSVPYDQQSNFNATTGYFIAPVTGVYLCIFKTYQQNYGSNGYIHWLFSVGGTVSWNGGTTPYNIYGYDKNTYADGVDVSAMIKVSAGNGIAIEAHSGGDERFYSDYTYFGIYLLG